MPCRCSLGGCNNESGKEKGISVYKFPPVSEQPELFAKWEKEVGRTRLSAKKRKWKAGPGAGVCSLHFEEKCFDTSHDQNRSLGIVAHATRRLLFGAVPTLMKESDWSRKVPVEESNTRGAYSKRERSRVSTIFLYCISF
jgi:hypothetical protein